MKSLLVIISLFLSVNLSAQQLAKRNHVKSVTSQEMSLNKDFQTYASEVDKLITDNDKSITDLRFTLSSSLHSNKKLASKVNSLEEENNELKTDLSNFTKYGEGDWKQFKIEFSQDMSLLTGDFDMLKQEFVKEEMLASRKN